MESEGTKVSAVFKSDSETHTVTTKNRGISVATPIMVAAMMLLVSVAIMVSSQHGNDASEAAYVSATDEGYVDVGMMGTVEYWNPLNPVMPEDYIAAYLMYSCLFTYDEDWGGPVYDLATWYHQVVHANASMTTYINITTNAYFRSLANPDFPIDGTAHPLTARDVAYTFDLIKANPGCTFYPYLADLSFTALEAMPGSGVWDVVSVWCPYAKATLIDDLSMIPIVPMHLWGPEGQNYEANALGSMDPDEQVGSGPFVFEDWERDSWYVFMTAPNYHGAMDYGAVRTVKVPGVLYKVISDPTSMCIEVNKGTIDCAVLTGCLSAFNDVLGVDTSVNVYKAAVAENGITDIAINALPDAFDEGAGYLNRHPALQDPFVRKAIAMTLNKDYIVNSMMAGLPVMADSVLAPGFWQADIENEIAYDPLAARAMLEANGWSDLDGDDWLEATASAYGVQKGLFPVGTELSYIRCQAIDTDDNYGKIAEAWPAWAKDAGIQLIGTVESESTMVNKAWYAADYDIWIWHWGWGPEPIEGALTVWLTSEIEKGGDNCQMPMGPWWAHEGNYTTCPYISQEMIDEYDLSNPDTWDGRFSAYDQNLTDAKEIFDPLARKAVLDKLQQWIYDSYTEMPPWYDLGLYGYTDSNFVNWGDWEAHSGLTVASGLPWIWFQLEPIGDNQLPVFVTPPLATYEAIVDEPITFTIGVSDPDGDPIGLNWSFGDGVHDGNYLVGDTTVERIVSFTHVYTEPASDLTLTIALNDHPQHSDEVIATATVDVLPVPDDPPIVLNLSYDPTSAIVGQEVSWSILAVDPEQGPDEYGLLFHWDWDDGTYSQSYYENVTNGVPVIDSQIHAWDEPGIYYVTINVIDGPNNVSASAPYVVVAETEERCMSYRWYDMFAHEPGPWIDYRTLNYGDEWVVTDSYPYIMMKEEIFPGNTAIHSFMRMEAEGTNLSDLSMIDNPEFLPIFGDVTGGNAHLLWQMDYATYEECEGKLSPQALTYYDGWYVELNGSTTLDRQAAKSVFGITEGQFNQFNTWWAANSAMVTAEWLAWLDYEGNDRLDIYNAYDYWLELVYFAMDAQKVGNSVIITMDTIGWGIEVLMTHWLRDTFMPTEWYFEDMYLVASIGPDAADVRFDAAVACSVSAYESVLDGTPCWVWQAMVQDHLPSTPDHPDSEFDPYYDLEFLERSPGNLWNGDMVPYDYTPGAWNLLEGETLTFEWPEDEVLFFFHDEGNMTGLIEDTGEIWSEMTVLHSEPYATDSPEQITIDEEARIVVFEGPFDMLDWSEEQTQHEWLADEWDRLGVLPYGIPYIEFVPAQEVETPPIAIFTVTPDVGYIGTEFTVDASNSYDLEDPAEVLEVRWDWNNDGVWDTNWTTNKVAAHQIFDAGVHTIALEVKDSDGLTDTDFQTVQVFDCSFEQGDFPDRVFTIVKSEDCRGRVEYVTTMTPSLPYDWRLKLISLDGSKVVVSIYEDAISVANLLIRTEMTVIGSFSEDILLEAGREYWVVFEYYGKSGLAELVEHATPGVAPTEHDPILINGNDDFTYENGVVQGDGSAQDPYVIEGWDIEADTAHGIEIRNTLAHFIIRDVEIFDGLDIGWYSGIKLYQVANGTIMSCTITNCADGVYVQGGDHLQILDNNITACVNGIGIIDTVYIDVFLNRIVWASVHGMHINSSIAFWISNNTIMESGMTGVGVGLCWDGTIAGNFVAYSGYRGIALTCSNGVTVYYNTMMNNTVQAEDDNPSMNSWNLPYPYGGNYWSDYDGVDLYSGPNQDLPGSDGIGDTPYTVGVIDLYPQMIPYLG